MASWNVTETANYSTCDPNKVRMRRYRYPRHSNAAPNRLETPPNCPEMPRSQVMSVPTSLWKPGPNSIPSDLGDTSILPLDASLVQTDYACSPKGGQTVMLRPISVVNSCTLSVAVIAGH